MEFMEIAARLLSSESRMDNLKQHIYWMCDELRRLEQWGMGNSVRFRELKKEVMEMQDEYDKAKKRYDSFMEECSKNKYFPPSKKSS